MPEQTVGRDYSSLYVPAAIIIAGIIIGVALIIALKPSAGNLAGGGDGAPTQTANIEDVSTDGDPYIGEKNAPVTLAYWSDYQCPFCKQFEEQTLSTLISKYVDTGKLRVVFKDYAFLSEDSTTAAIYGRAVWDMFPTKYFAWREAMYSAQDEEHGGFGDEPSIVALTRTISGIDADAVKAHVTANRAAYEAAIDEDRTEGTGFGIQGTPGFITGKVMIPGSVPVAQFEEAIDAQL